MSNAKNDLIHFVQKPHKIIKIAIFRIFGVLKFISPREATFAYNNKIKKTLRAQIVVM
jgi:hypothetical protein